MDNFSFGVFGGMADLIIFFYKRRVVFLFLYTPLGGV
jgi:hypothetical protein